MKLSVNNISIEELGIRLIEHSYKEIIQWSALKSVETNDWAEYDGIEPDLTAPTLESRTITLNFLARGLRVYESFVEMITEQTYNDLYFHELETHYSLRLSKSDLKEQYTDLQAFSLTLIEDAVTKIDADYVPQDFAYNIGGFSIDGIGLDELGITALDGTLQNFRQIPGVKFRLAISENTMDGTWYDSLGEQFLKEQDFTMRLLIRANNVETLMRNYYAFLNFLTMPNERFIFHQPTMEEVPCYYKSQSVEEVHLQGLTSGMVGIAFNVNFCITERSKSQTTYLVDDDGITILTTDDDILLKGD